MRTKISTPYTHENGEIDAADYPGREMRWRDFEDSVHLCDDGSIIDYRNVPMDKIPFKHFPEKTLRIMGDILGGKDILSKEYMDNLEN